MTKLETLALLEDVNASITDALERLNAGNTNEAIAILRAILDPVREAIADADTGGE